MESDEEIYIENAGPQHVVDECSDVTSEKIVTSVVEQSERPETNFIEDDGDRIVHESAGSNRTVVNAKSISRSPDYISNRKRKSQQQTTTTTCLDHQDGAPVLLPNTDIELCTLRQIIHGYYNALDAYDKRSKYEGDFHLFIKTLDSFITLPYVDDIPNEESSEILKQGYQAAQSTLTSMWNHVSAQVKTTEYGISDPGEETSSFDFVDVTNDINEENKQNLRGGLGSQTKFIVEKTPEVQFAVEIEKSNLDDDDKRTPLPPATNGELDSTSVDISILMDEIKRESRLQFDRQHRLLAELETQKARNERILIEKERNWESERRRINVQLDEQVQHSERVLKERETSWEKERQTLQHQIEEQTEQIQGFNPMMQKNRILLEQERLKIEELEEDLEAANTKHQLIEGEYEDYQRTADKMRKDLEKEIREKELLLAETERRLREDLEAANERYRIIQEEFDEFQIAAGSRQKDLEEHLKDKDLLLIETKKLLREHQELEEIHTQHIMADQLRLASIAPNDGNDGLSRLVAIRIPSDLEASGGAEFHGEHVTELDWELKDSSGKFTGWLNLEGLPNSHGILRMEGGSVYDGEWKLGEWNGALYLGIPKRPKNLS